MSTALAGIYIIEKDINSDLFTWTFANYDQTVDSVLKARCGLKDDSCIGEFFVSKYQNTWQYFLSAPVDRQDPAKKVVSASIILLAEDLNVAKYNALLVLLLQHYLQSYSSVPVLQSYLSAYAAGKAAGPAQGETAPLKWVDSSFDARLSLIAPVHKLIDLVGIEAVLIWVAVLTKKRIVVYHPNAAVVSQLTRAVLALGAWHRQNTTILRPLVTLAEAELRDLSSLNVYVAGTTDAKVTDNTALYDICIDAPGHAIRISPAAKAAFAMGKYHKGVAELLVKAAEAGKDQPELAAAQLVIKAVAQKTKELLDQLTACAGEAGAVTSDTLAAMGVPANVQNFMCSVAAAEGIATSQ